jgi:hypothetical protein
MTLNEAKSRIRGYIKKYYQEVRPEILNRSAFRQEQYGYTVSLSHGIGKKKGWQGHN